MVELIKLIAPSFYSVHRSVQTGEYTHFWLSGGRGSTKSSFTGIEIVLGVIGDSAANAVILRKVKDTLRSSVYNQVKWAIDILEVGHLFRASVSPLEFVYLPTGQKIIFRGTDDPVKLKSIKLPKGYCKYVWFEELDEFEGMDEVNNINQSLLRGGDRFICFYSYNPPKSIQSWVNLESKISRSDRLIHKSDYRTVPKEWLGEQFLIEAEHMRQTKPELYDHDYLGKITGTGGEIFNNVTIRTITNEEIAEFDRIRRGIDWGYAVDPFHYTVCHYDKTRRRLYIFFEIHQVKLSNREAIRLIKAEAYGGKREIICDNAEPKSIAELISNNLAAKPCKKGPDSVEYGIKFLQDLEEIIIDGERCPNTMREFLNYELEKDAHGIFKAGYPDKNNHSIDAVRYALNDDAVASGWSWIDQLTGKMG
jgi:PBSX family phage terminase large subunit